MSGRVSTYTHRFVKTLPDSLEDGVLYISILYATAAHKCCCGCGKEVVTPLHPTDWQLIFDGETVSLNPSVGNWSFPCRSHYWLERGQVIWAPGWSEEKISLSRARSRFAKKLHYGTAAEDFGAPRFVERQSRRPSGRWWRRFYKKA